MLESDLTAFEPSGSNEVVPTDLIIDGTQQLRQRTKNPGKQEKVSSGKKIGSN
jgi:hypothetical protein